jgi:hypothetical protein
MKQSPQWWIIEMRGLYVARIFCSLKHLRKTYGRISVVDNVVSVYATESEAKNNAS